MLTKFLEKQKNIGRDEKGCLLLTEKKAAINFNCQRLPFSTSRRRPSCPFLLVDVNHCSILLVDGNFHDQL